MASYAFHPLHLLVLAVEGPRALANHFGYFTKSFRIGNRTLTRPAEFTSPAQQAVFQRIGDQLANKAYAGGGLCAWLSDSEIEKKAQEDKGGKTYPLETWHEVLAFFVGEGCFDVYWRLLFTDRLGYKQVPRWNADGTPIKGLDDIHYRDPHVGELPFWPGRLSEEEMRARIGTRYVSLPANPYGDWMEETVTLGPEHFEMIYSQRKNLFEDWIG